MFITVIWGTTFPLLKSTVDTLSPALLVATRFLIAALVLAPWLARVPKRLWLEGGAVGVLLFLSYWTQVMGLTTIPSGRAAFITGLNVILVPLFLPFLRQRVPWTAFVAAAVALTGIGLMSLNGFTLEFSVGDAWILACAVLFAVYIIAMDRLSARYAALPLTAVQVAVVCVCGLLFAAPELARGVSLEPLRDHWVVLVYLGVAATAVTTLVQSYAQRFVPAFQTAVIYALEPVCAAAFSFWWLRETLSVQGFVGAGLILAAMLLCQFDPVSAKRAANVQEHV